MDKKDLDVLDRLTGATKESRDVAIRRSVRVYLKLEEWASAGQKRPCELRLARNRPISLQKPSVGGAPAWAWALTFVVGAVVGFVLCRTFK
jgi:hypothetical protein